MFKYRVVAFALAGTVWGSAGAAELARSPVVVEVALPGKPLPFGARASVAVSVTNRGKLPVAVADVGLTAAAGALWREDLTAEVPVTLRKTGGVIDGVLEAEDIGPQARTPPPPRWRWKGEERLKTFLVLAPGERLERTASFVVADGADRVEAAASWAPAERAWGLRSARYEPIQREPSAGMSEGVYGVARLTASFEPGPAVAKLPPEALEGRLRLRPYGLPTPAFAKLAWTAAQATVALPVDRPHCTLEEARRRAGGGQGEAVYVRSLGAWAVEAAAKETALVYPDGVKRVPGRLAAAFSSLVDAEKVRIEVFTWAPQDDVDGLAAHLRTRGFDVRVREQKGGTWQADVEVDAAALLRLASALSEMGRLVEGTRVEK